MKSTKRPGWIPALMAAVLALASFAALAQRSDGSIAGNAVPGDKIHVVGTNNGFDRELAAGENGKYRFGSVPTGNYRVTVTRGEEVVLQASVAVRAGSTARPPTPTSEAGEQSPDVGKATD
ncbi:MAG TPA: carboxypeptidase-like regulatory domain-containing protein [Pseudoxanthomonas sp.]|nr:carboxypeptidase-like regulatory domain-containing protein [Pseudoxanthomonas sp.]